MVSESIFAGNIPIDISFAQEQSSKSAGTLVASIIQTHLESQPALAPLALVLKTFLKQRGLGSAVSGGLGSYPLIVMIISFLQVSKVHLCQSVPKILTLFNFYSLTPCIFRLHLFLIH